MQDAAKAVELAEATLTGHAPEGAAEVTMQRRARLMKTAAVVLAVVFSTAIGGNGGAADTKRGGNMNQKLIEMTENALQVDEVLQHVVYQAYIHDGKIGEAVKGNYEIKPELILPWSVSDNSSVSVVKVKTTKGGTVKMYTFAFIFSAEGLQTVLLYPGGSNADPALFSDVFAPAKGYAQAALSSDEANIKDTKVVGQIRPTGWDEEWLWVDDKGKTYTMNIAFSTDADGQGTTWNIHGSGK